MWYKEEPFGRRESGSCDKMIKSGGRFSPGGTRFRTPGCRHNLQLGFSLSLSWVCFLNVGRKKKEERRKKREGRKEEERKKEERKKEEGRRHKGFGKV